MQIIRTGSILQEFDVLFLIMHPNMQAVPYVWTVAVWVGAPASNRRDQRTLAAVRKPWVLKVIIDDTRTQFALEGYRCEGHLRSRLGSSCTLSSLSTVETHG